jgi:predicted alpha/beta superfamily hydrolase
MGVVIARITMVVIGADGINMGVIIDYRRRMDRMTSITEMELGNNNHGGIPEKYPFVHPKTPPSQPPPPLPHE